MKASMPAAEGDEDLMEDSDDLASDLDDDEEENDSADELENMDGDDSGLSLAEGSDNEDLVPVDSEFSAGLIDYDGSDGEDEEWGGINGSQGATKTKRKREESSNNQRRKKLRSLPTFASYEDYAKMIEDGPEDDI